MILLGRSHKFLPSSTGESTAESAGDTLPEISEMECSLLNSDFAFAKDLKILELSRFNVGGLDADLDCVFLEGRAASSFLASGFSPLLNDWAGLGIVTTLPGFAFIAEVVGACGAAGGGGRRLMRLCKFISTFTGDFASLSRTFVFGLCIVPYCFQVSSGSSLTKSAATLRLQSDKTCKFWARLASFFVGATFVWLTCNGPGSRL